jgi:beta-glucosidase
MTDNTLFPADFFWGAATSAYQVEGSPLADGAGPSIWHRFSHTPGRTYNGDTGDTACDHYRRFEADIALMQTLGLNAYRFSIAWGRVLPEGRGRINAKGLSFYEQLVDALLQRGIEPFVTLYHWDLPLRLDELSGWLNRDIAYWFADYAQLMYRALGDRVRFWTTLNEPWVTVDAGYLSGFHAPGHASLAEAPLATHNLLRAHAVAVQAYRAEGGGQIGLVVNLEPKYPASNRPEDREATKRAHAYMNRQYLDPVFCGAYPRRLREIFGAHWPEFPDEDLRLIREPIDFLGVNYYTRSVVHHDPAVMPTGAGSVRQSGSRYTEMGWEVYPPGLFDTLRWLRDRYGKIPLYVTENGAAFADPPLRGERVHDPQRIDYLRRHLRAVREARCQEVDVRGYFAWSLLDNFEWSYGYSKRFGLIHVDFATQRRTLKDSSFFYRDVIQSGGAALGHEDAVGSGE